MNWDTREAMLWLANDEYAYRASFRVVADKATDAQDKADRLQAILSEVYIIDCGGGRIDYDLIDWDQIIAKIASDIAWEEEYIRRNT